MLSTVRNKAIFALIIANIIWGAASPIFKLALENITPMTLAYVRFLGAALLLFPFAYPYLSVKKEDLLKLFLFSIFGITINITFFFFGLKMAPSINAPIIASCGPIFLYFCAIRFLGEKPKRKILLGTFVSLIGVLTIVLQPLISQGFDGQLLGNIFFIIATIGSVGHAVFGKELGPKYKTVTLTFWSFIIGAFTFLPAFIVESYQSQPLLSLDWRGAIGIIFGIFLSSATAYYLYEWGLKRVEEQEVGIFTYIDPLVAVILAYYLLGEEVTPIFLIGAILVFSGIFIAEGRIHYHPIHKLKFR